MKNQRSAEEWQWPISLSVFPNIANLLNSTDKRLFAVSRRGIRDYGRFMHDLAIDIISTNPVTKVLFVDFEESEEKVKQKLIKSISALSNHEYDEKLFAEFEYEKTIGILTLEQLSAYKPNVRDLVGHRLTNLIDQIFMTIFQNIPVYVLVNNPEGLAVSLNHDQLEAHIRLWRVLETMARFHKTKIITTYAESLPDSRAYSSAEKLSFQKTQASNTIGMLSKLKRRSGNFQLIGEEF